MCVRRTAGLQTRSGRSAVVDKPPLLEFPTDYPIKVIGRPTAEFRARIHAIVLRHVPALEASHVTEHLSKNGNYISISYALRAESREQMNALAADLKGCSEVLLVI
jgi:uncharacterized protein